MDTRERAMCELPPSFKPPPTDSSSSPRPSGVPLEYLGNRECRFPVSQTKDGEHLFCGQPIGRGSYCTPLVLGLPAGLTAQSQGDLAGSPLGCAV